MMKTLLRVAAVLSFLSFFGAAVALLDQSQKHGGEILGLVLGLFCMGLAFFVGPLLFAIGERFADHGDSDLPQ